MAEAMNLCPAEVGTSINLGILQGPLLLHEHFFGNIVWDMAVRELALVAAKELGAKFWAVKANADGTRVEGRSDTVTVAVGVDGRHIE